MSDTVIEAARATGQAYEVVPCDPELADTAAFCATYGYRLDQSANAILVVGKSEPRVYAVCLVLADTRLDVNGVVRRRLGAKKASFASAEAATALTDMVVGGVTAFGLPDGVPLWIDAAVMARPSIILGGGSRRRKLRVVPAELLRVAGAEVVEGLANPVDLL